MAKKRKVRSSDPDHVEEEPQQQDQDTAVELDHQHEQPPNPEPTPDLEEPNHMPSDDDQEENEEQEPEDQPQNDAVEGKEQEPEEAPELEQQQQQQQETLIETVAEVANGTGTGTENNEEEEEDLELEDEPVEKLLEPFTKEQLHALVKQAAEKYPDFVENVRQLADVDPAHRKIFVHGLGWDTTAEMLTGAFSRYGEIEDCKAVTDKVTGKSKGYAFILFKHRDDCRRALKNPQKKIGNRTTSSQLASAGPVPPTPPNAPPVSEYTQRKIFVSNVSPDIEPQKLLVFFQQFGEVEDGPLGLDKNTGRPKGFALFVYKSVESAKKALEEPHKIYEGHTLYCQKAVDGPKGSKGFYQNHHQHQHQPQHHSHHHQPHYKKSKYSSGGGPSHGGGGHLMAPSTPGVGGFNPGVQAPALNPALGQALALLANQGSGLALGNLLGGFSGAPVNQAGPPAAAGAYGNQAAMNYGNQQGMQPGYQNPQMGQGSGVRPPYMGH